MYDKQINSIKSISCYWVNSFYTFEVILRRINVSIIEYWQLAGLRWFFSFVPSTDWGTFVFVPVFLSVLVFVRFSVCICKIYQICLLLSILRWFFSFVPSTEWSVAITGLIQLILYHYIALKSEHHIFISLYLHIIISS